MRFLLELLGTRHRAFCSIAACCLIVLMLAPVGKANILPPGGTVAPDINVGANYGPVKPGGDTGVQNFNFAGNSGTVEELVTTDPVSGHLDFLMQVNVTGVGPTGHIQHLSVADFTNAFLLGPVDVGFDTTTCIAAIGCAAGTAVAPTTVNEMLGTIEFNFAAAVLAGHDSFLLFVKTQSDVFAPGTLGLIDGGGQTLNGFQPTPEPAQAGILLGGLFAAGLFFARRFQTRVN
jgi:hypothetical protein